jgi:D-glycero-alpha-D-manno-heptose-7-phosphate kinase
VTYSENEVVKNVSDIKNNLVREAMKLTGVTSGIHITSIADIPSEGTGMGSSSSYIVGLLHALYAFGGKHVSAERLAKEACQIEIGILKKPIGKQDQYIAAYGGFQFIQFNPDESVYVDPVIFSPKTKDILEKHLLLLYTGLTRSSTPILSKQTKAMKDEASKRKSMTKMVELAHLLRKKLRKNRINVFGELLHENWLLKKKMADGISNKKIDQWYETARRKGAVGGKLLGAGGGGFLLFFAPPEKHATIIRALPNLRALPFKFEHQGSKIIFVGD